MDIRCCVVKPVSCIVIGLFVAGCSANDQTRVEFPEEVKWVAAQADIVSVLTEEAGECINPVSILISDQDLALGRLAFRSPYLLGGQATRRGLSCHSCHSNGDINPDFFIQGLSGAPGTADVTNFHFSKNLGDHEFNSKPIPSLTALAAVTTETERNSREAFILRLVEDEFGGNKPSIPVKKALIGYIEAMDIEDCPSAPWRGMDMLNHGVSLVDAGITLLEPDAYQESDYQNFLLASLRNELGRLHVRFSGANSLRQQLVELSQLLKSGENVDLKAVNDMWSGIKPQFHDQYENSFFSAEYTERQLVDD